MTHDDMELAAKVALPLLGAAWAGVRWAYPPMKRAVVAGHGLVRTLNTVADDVSVIKKEVFPNGGSSLSDRVDQTRELVRGLRHESQLMRAVQRTLTNEQMGIGRFECDPYGQCVWVSQQWSTWTGIPVGEAIGNGWSAGIHHEDRQRVFDTWASAVIDRRPFAARCRYRHVLDGSDTAVYVDAHPVEADTGECVGWVGTARLLTEEA